MAGGSPLLLRLIGVPIVAYKLADAWLATALTVAYRLDYTGAAELLGALTPGDSYQRLVPLMDVTPAWLHGLWLLAGVLFLGALARLVGGGPAPHVFILLGLGIEILASLLGRPMIEATGVVVHADATLFATLILPYGVPILLALLLALSAKRKPA